jgi:RNA polymerase sigma-70 factor (ECF subfamily)
MVYRSAERPYLRAVREDAPGPALSDAQIVEGVASGDPRVAGALHDRLIGAVDQALYRVMGCRGSDHDDLVQMSFEQIVRTLTQRSFAGNCSLKTWASRITTHVALNALRSRRRERRVFERRLVDHRPDERAEEGGATAGAHEPGERRAEARLELERVRQHLASMNPRRAEALVLHDVHGHDLNEIAAMLHLSVAAVQSRLVRGRRELQARLAADGIGPEGKGASDG